MNKLLTDDALANTPFLILGNKIDARNAVSEAQLKAALGVEHSTGKNVKSVPEGTQPIEVFMCSIVKRHGFKDGFQWLSNFLG